MTETKPTKKPTTPAGDIAGIILAVAVALTVSMPLLAMSAGVSVWLLCRIGGVCW